MKQILLIVLLMFILNRLSAQTITSMQSGNWNDPATWVGNSVPGSANDVVVAATHTVTMNVSGSTVNGLTVNASGVLIIASGNSFFVSQDVSNSGTININANGGLRISENLLNGGVITGGVNSIVIVGGDQFENTGSFQTSFLYCSTVALGANSTDLTISGSGVFTIINLLMQKNSGGTVLIDVPMILSAAVNLGAGAGGRLIIGDGDLQVNSISSGSATGTYIIFNGTGRLIHAGGNATKFLPVGTETAFTPITISGGNTATHALAVRVSSSFTAPPASTAVVNAEWTIDDVTGGADVGIALQWPGAAEGVGFNRGSCTMARYNGSNWQPVTPFAAATGSNPYTRAATDITEFGSFLVGSSGSFPVISAQSGNWNSGSTWEGGIIPAATTDNVIIATGHVVSFDPTPVTIHSLVLNNGSTLQLNAGTVLTSNTGVSNAGSIILNNTGSLRVGGTITNSGSISSAVGAGGTVLSVGGDLENLAGSVNVEAIYFSTVTLGGNTVMQTVNSNNSLLSFDDIFLFNSGVNIHFNASMSTGNLHLSGSGGNLVLQNGNLSVSGAINGAAATKYIQMNGTGYLFRTGAASPKFFPVGTSSSYSPLTISNGNVATHNFFVRVSDNFTNPPLNSAVVNREWIIVDNTGGANVDLTFQWNASDENPAFMRSASYVGHFNGTEWHPVSTMAPAVGSDPYTKTATGVTTFSPFGIGSSGALPVHLLSFTAFKNNDKIELKWKVVNEVDFSHYLIERSVDGNNFLTVGSVTATNTAGIKEYTHLVDGENSVSYFRLKMVDIDGGFKYSMIVRVEAFSMSGLLVYPNPARGRIFIRAGDEPAVLQIYSSTGMLMMSRKITGPLNEIDISGLAAGIFVVRLETSAGGRSLMLEVSR